MRKYQIMHSQIFLCSKYSHYRLKISCTNQQDKIIHIWQDLHGKKIEKDVIKIKYSKHKFMDLWACF